jgi:hypothetical protein
MTMLMYKKVSKDREREVLLCIENKIWVQKLFNKGKETSKETFTDETAAIMAFNKMDIGETY